MNKVRINRKESGLNNGEEEYSNVLYSFFLIRYFHLLRIFLKLFKVRVLNLPTNSFCKRCGVDVRDFSVTDDIWKQIEPHIKYGYTLCYNCFSDIWHQLGNKSTWKLEELK